MLNLLKFYVINRLRNKVQLTGYLGRYSEVKRLEKKKIVAKFL